MAKENPRIKQILQELANQDDENFLVPGNAVRGNTIDYYLKLRGLPNNYDEYCQTNEGFLTKEDRDRLAELKKIL